MTKQKIIKLLALPVFFLLISYVAWMATPGAYAKSESYELKVSEKELIEIIQEIKIEQPKLNLTQEVKIPTGEVFQLKEGRSESSPDFYSCFFYYPDKEQIIQTGIKAVNDSTTKFVFMSINNGLILGNTQTVNESFFWFMNTARKSEFEQRILVPIKEKINQL